MEEQNGRRAEATRKDFNTVLIRQDKKFITSALQGDLGRNPIDPTLQDNMLIPNNFFEYILSCWMCNQFTLNKFRIDSGRTKF